MNIRKATKRDFNRIFEIMKNEYIKAPYFEKWEKKGAFKTIKYYLSVGNCFVAVFEKKVIGFVIFREEDYNIGPNIIVEELVIDSDYQGKGVGRSLMDEVEKYSKKKKAVQILLTTHRGAPAYKFYIKVGYKPVKSTVFLKKELK